MEIEIDGNVSLIEGVFAVSATMFQEKQPV
jgi:hypothetical protein